MFAVPPDVVRCRPTDRLGPLCRDVALPREGQPRFELDGPEIAWVARRSVPPRPPGVDPLPSVGMGDAAVRPRPIA